MGVSSKGSGRASSARRAGVLRRPCTLPFLSRDSTISETWGRPAIGAIGPWPLGPAIAVSPVELDEPTHTPTYFAVPGSNDEVAHAIARHGTQRRLISRKADAEAVAPVTTEIRGRVDGVESKAAEFDTPAACEDRARFSTSASRRTSATRRRAAATAAAILMRRARRREQRHGRIWQDGSFFFVRVGDEGVGGAVSARRFSPEVLGQRVQARRQRERPPSSQSVYHRVA